MDKIKLKQEIDKVREEWILAQKNSIKLSKELDIVWFRNLPTSFSIKHLTRIPEVKLAIKLHNKAVKKHERLHKQYYKLSAKYYE